MQTQQLTTGKSGEKTATDIFVRYLLYSAGAIIGIAIANTIANLLWSAAFARTEAFGHSNKLKYVFYVVLFSAIVSSPDTIEKLIASLQQYGTGFYTHVVGCIFPSA
jgi:hypothetical protein